MTNYCKQFTQEHNEDFKTKQTREDIILSLTNKQYINLKLMAYKAGFLNAGDLLQSFVSDLTCWQSNGSDEKECAAAWYERAHGDWNYRCFFQYYLYNHDFDLDEMQELLEDQDLFDETYDEYKEDAWGVEIQSKEQCLELLKNIIATGSEL